MPQNFAKNGKKTKRTEFEFDRWSWVFTFFSLLCVVVGVGRTSDDFFVSLSLCAPTGSFFNFNFFSNSFSPKFSLLLFIKQ